MVSATTADIPPQTVTAPSQPALDAIRVLLNIVAERTGYPADMLGLDQDLEAELGIDSIKRVEILGAFRKSLPPDAAQSMQSGMERYTRAKTLHAIIAIARGDLATVASPVEIKLDAANLVTATPPAVAAMDRSTLTTRLLSIVAERTGYPTDMLGLDQDLEAELGIDSIKRVEVLGALRKTFFRCAGCSHAGRHGKLHPRAQPECDRASSDGTASGF